MDLRKWFEKNYVTAQELWVGFFKKSSGKASITWPVDEALCFGWIAGIRKNVDDAGQLKNLKDAAGYRATIG